MSFITKAQTNNSNCPIFPGEDYLEDYEGVDIGSIISTLYIEALTTGRTEWQLGNSGTYITITYPLLRGDASTAMFKAGVSNFVSLAKEALPCMDPVYAAFYRHFIDDYDKNGIFMPFKGKL